MASMIPYCNCPSSSGGSQITAGCYLRNKDTAILGENAASDVASSHLCHSSLSSALGNRSGLQHQYRGQAASPSQLSFLLQKAEIFLFGTFSIYKEKGIQDSRMKALFNPLDFWCFNCSSVFHRSGFFLCVFPMELITLRVCSWSMKPYVPVLVCEDAVLYCKDLSFCGPSSFPKLRQHSLTGLSKQRHNKKGEATNTKKAILFSTGHYT